MGINLLPSHKAPSISEEDKRLGIIYPAEVIQGFQNDHKIIMGVKRLQLDLAKYAYEYLGEDYKKTNSKIDYESEVYEQGIPIVYPKTVDWSNIDWRSLGDPRNAHEAVDACILFFRHEVGVQDYVIAGMMGCVAHESGFYSHIVNMAEKYAKAGYQSRVKNKNYGVGFWANTGEFKFRCQRAIGPEYPDGYALEAQPLSTQMQLSFGKGTGDKFRSLIECIQNNLPWKPDIKDLIKKKLKELKEIPPEEETGKNQYWEKEGISEIEELAVYQACDCWSWCGEHGSYGFSTGNQNYMSLRKVFPSNHLFPTQPGHQQKRRASAIEYYKYMKHLRDNPGDI